jgi:hypothetical protein
MTSLFYNPASSWLKRMRDGFLRLISVPVESQCKSVSVNDTSRIFGPFNDTFCFSKGSHKLSPSCVSGLLNIGREPAIFWCVVTVIVLTLYSQIFPVTMGGGPSFKNSVIVLPRFVHLDTTTTIVRVRLAGFVVASGFDALPDSVQPCGVSGAKVFVTPFEPTRVLAEIYRAVAAETDFSTTVSTKFTNISTVHVSPPCDSHIDLGGSRPWGSRLLEQVAKSAPIPTTNFITKEVQV